MPQVSARWRVDAFFDGPPAQRFSDVAGAHQAGIAAVAEAGIAGGFPDASFRPAAPVSRGQTATFLARALDLVDRLDPDAPRRPPAPPGTFTPLAFRPISYGERSEFEATLNATAIPELFAFDSRGRGQTLAVTGWTPSGDLDLFVECNPDLVSHGDPVRRRRILDLPGDPRRRDHHRGPHLRLLHRQRPDPSRRDPQRPHWPSGDGPPPLHRQRRLVHLHPAGIDPRPVAVAAGTAPHDPRSPADRWRWNGSPGDTNGGDGQRPVAGSTESQPMSGEPDRRLTSPSAAPAGPDVRTHRVRLTQTGPDAIGPAAHQPHDRRRLPKATAGDAPANPAVDPPTVMPPPRPADEEACAAAHL